MEHRSSIPIELLTFSGQVSDLAHILLQERCIAIDTESNSRHRYPERVCLVQVATHRKVYLIDPLSVDDITPIGDVLADETVVKVIQPELPISSCLDPSNAPSSTRAIVVSLTDAVNHPIKLTKPSLGVVNWRSMGSGGGFHHVCTPFKLLRARTSPLVASLHL